MGCSRSFRRVSGLRPTARGSPLTLMCGYLEPRLRGECECTYMSVRHVHRSLPAVVVACMLLLICMFVRNKCFGSSALFVAF